MQNRQTGTNPRQGQPVAKLSRTAIGWLAMALMLAACTNGGGENEKRSRAAAEQDRRDVPVPSITNPDSSSPDRHSWQRLWRTTPGTPERRCLDVGAHTDVRSGDFVAGNFAVFIHDWDGTEATSKLYYIPAAPREGQPLDVVAELVGDAAPQKITFTFGLTAWTLDGIPFYASGTVLPTRGRWRLTAMAGESSGCFELTL